MKFLVYANLNDNYSVSNCREISKKRARAFNPPPSRIKFPKIPLDKLFSSSSSEIFIFRVRVRSPAWQSYLHFMYKNLIE